MRNGRDRLIAQGRRPLVFDNRRPNLLDGKRRGPGPPTIRGSRQWSSKAEIPQVIELFRLVYTTKRKTVYTPCGIPTDELVEGRGPPVG